MGLSAASVAEGLRAKKKAQTRTKLQETALRLFQERGFAAVSVDEIATEADVSRSTFFRYFGSKEAVLLGDRDESGDLFLSRLSRPGPESPLKAFEQALFELTRRAAAEDALDHHRTVSVLLRSDPALRAHRLTELERWSDAMAQAFAERAGRGEPNLEDRLASGICLAVGEEISRLVQENGSQDPEVVIKAVFESLRAL